MENEETEKGDQWFKTRKVRQEFEIMVFILLAIRVHIFMGFSYKSKIYLEVKEQKRSFFFFVWGENLLSQCFEALKLFIKS